MNLQLSAISRATIAGVSLTLAGILTACSDGTASGNPAPSANAVKITGADGHSQITLWSDAGQIVKTSSVLPPVAAPASEAYPLGFFGYSITGLKPGQTVTVTLEMPAGTRVADYVKCDMGLTTCQVVDESQVKVNGNRLLLTLTDGGKGDEDGVADGTIVDPGAPALKLPSASASYLIPYAISYTGTTDDGLYTVSSDDPTAPPQLIVSGTEGIYSMVMQKALTDTDGNIYQTVADTAFFSMSPPPFTNSPAQLYKLDLGKTSGAATAVPIGNTSQTDYECEVSIAERTTNEPSSAMILDWRSSADGWCYTADDVVYLSQATDDAVTALVATPMSAAEVIYQKVVGNVTYGIICCSTATPIYDASSLGMAGIVYRDADNRLVFGSPSFSGQPITLLTGITLFSSISREPGAVFVIAGTTTSASLYRIGSDGSISASLHEFQPSSLPQAYFSSRAIADQVNGNLWFSDNGATFSTGDFFQGKESHYDVELLRAPLSGALPAEVMYSASGDLPPTFANTYYVAEPVSATSMLVFTVQPYMEAYDGENGLYTSQAPATMYTLPLEAPANTAPSIVTGVNGQISTSAVQDGRIFANIATIDSTGHQTGTSIEVLGLDGSILKAIPDALATGAAEQLRGTIRNPQYLKTALYFAQNPNASLPDMSGATLYALSAADLSQTPISLSNGDPYVQQYGEFDSFSYSLMGLQPVISRTSTSQGLNLLDTSRNRWIPVFSRANSGEIRTLWNLSPNLGSGYLF